MTSLVPDRYSTALICVHGITMSGHTVIFTNTEADTPFTYRAYPGNGANPLILLRRLSTLRHLHPLTETLPHLDQTHIA